MRRGIHPNYHDINVTMTDGTVFQTRSTFGKPGDNISLDIDNKTHPAWTGVRQSLERGGRMDRFQQQYGNLGV